MSTQRQIALRVIGKGAFWWLAAALLVFALAAIESITMFEPEPVPLLTGFKIVVD